MRLDKIRAPLLLQAITAPLENGRFMPAAMDEEAVDL